MMLKRYRTKAKVNEEMIKKSKQIKTIGKWKHFDTVKFLCQVFLLNRHLNY